MKSELDKEWIVLILKAKHIGFTKDEIRKFIAQSVTITKEQK